jgi:hypothetical protein
MAKDKVKDSRFEGLRNDPRFKRPAAKKSKTVIDSRFKRILTDEKFRSTSTVDPRGIQTKTPKAKKSLKAINEELSKFYDLDDEAKSDLGETRSVSDNEGRFEWNAESSSDESEALEIASMASDDEQPEEDVPLGDTTDRIAVMNCNWDHVSSSDIFVLLQSFLDTNAPGRKVKKVTIHKSEFGAERMEREEMYGPLIEGMPSDNEEDDSLKTKAELAELEERRNVAIRNYERLKRRYYFAIADFDSINTACLVYDELDGVCGGFVSEALDMRFVPEDTPDPSEKHPPVSEADHVPSDYIPPSVETGNLTMEHSKVKCTWDEDPPERKILMRKFTPAQIANMDLDAYLESASDADEVDVGNLKALLGADEESGSSEAMGDMEMSFSRAVESIGKDVSKRLAETGSANQSDLSQWEQYLEKRKDAKKSKKMERRQQIESQKIERQAAAKANTSAARKLREEEGNKSSDDEQEVDAAALAQDSRLNKLFNDPRFAVDPTHPSFNKNSVVNKIRRKK